MPWTRAHHNGKVVESSADQGGMTFPRVGIQLYLLVRACPFSQNRVPTLGQVRGQAFCGTCFRLDGKRPGREPGPWHWCVAGGRDQKSIPPIPPPGPPGGMAGGCFFGTSATIASVVIRRPATELASCRAVRTTLVGSMMPFETILPYSPVW